ncbi:hypothetical protein ACLKA6_004241 [Drosophila palustris]
MGNKCAGKPVGPYHVLRVLLPIGDCNWNRDRGPGAAPTQTFSDSNSTAVFGISQVCQLKSPAALRAEHVTHFDCSSAEGDVLWYLQVVNLPILQLLLLPRRFFGDMSTLIMLRLS